MASTNHDLRSDHGRTLYMPEHCSGENGFGNLSLPDVYAADDAVSLYPRGTRLVQGERSFYYGTYLGVVTNAGTSVTATNGDDLAGKFLLTNAIQTDMANGLLVRKISGDQSIVYNTIVSAARSNDFYSGGWVTGKDTTPSDERMFWRFIVKHEHQGTGTTTKIWNKTNQAYTTVDLSSYSNVGILELDQPVINSKTSMSTTLMQNPWKRIIWQNDTAYVMARGRVAGACMHNDPTATRHVWFQTHGPMFCPHLEFTLGTLGGEALVLMGDGSISPRGSSFDRFASNTYFPIIGYMLSDTFYPSGSATTELLPMIFVTIQR